MRVISRSLLVCVVGVVLGGFSQAIVAVAAESHGEEAQGGSLLGAPLVVSSTDRFFLGGEESQAAREATRSNPLAVAARAASRTSFEGLAPGQTASEAKVAFPNLIEQSAGGPPRLPAGQRIVGYATDNAAQVSLPGGDIGVVESLEPIAARTAHGHHAPLDLRLEEADGGGNFQPARSDAGVDVPKDLSDGVSLSSTGVSLTPVDGHGSPLAASEGALDGSAVVWEDSEGGAAGVHDLATLAKPSPEGFDLTSMLLSQRSPNELYFRVGMPAGARLEGGEGGSARVVKDGVVLAIVSPVSAQDAEGSDVPVSMDVHGDMLALTVDLSGDYLYPIAVDPEVNDGQLATTSGGKHTNWEFHTSNSGKFAGSAVYEGVGKEHVETKGIAEYKAAEFAYWGYQTKGNSKIYELKTETSAKNKNAKIENFLEFEESGGAQETKKLLSTEAEGTTEYENKASVLCAANTSKVEECLPAAGKEHNSVHFQQSATAAPGSNYKFSDTMSQGIVSISEPAGTHSTTSFNTTSSELELEIEKESKKEKVKRTNVLHGTGSWLTKSNGAFESIAKDPGIGVAATKLEYESSAGKWEQIAEHSYLEKENACQGVQCYETHGEDWTLPKLPDGEDKIRYKAEEAMSGTSSLETEGTATVKVDATPPNPVRIVGLPDGDELSERPYELTTEATDGEGSSIASSGVKSTTLFIDGKSIEDKEVKNKETKEAGKKEGECAVAKGACTATAKWTVNGAELGAGHHSIQVVVFDNAGNEARLPGGGTQISIRHSSPVRLGPGSVDLESGDFSLGAGDVSQGSGLTVGRNYSSRDLTTGMEGPLGPQWSLSLGNTESLLELIDGGVLLTSGNGSQTIFPTTPGEKGKFESPPGDSNLQLKLEENTETKHKLAYYLEDTAAHTKTKFTLPSSTAKTWVPTKQEGTVATDTVTYEYQTIPQEPTEYSLSAGATPDGLTAGPDGKLWFTSSNTAKVGKTTTSGAVTEYALPEGATPYKMTAGPDGNLWYTSQIVGPGKIGKITTSGTVTEYAAPLGHSRGITTGPDGNLWFTEGSNHKIGKMTTAGAITEYPLTEGLQPEEITTGPDGNMWFTTAAVNSYIGKITPSGTVSSYSIPVGSDPGGIAAGPDGNVWFTDENSSKISKITPSGSATEYALPAGSKPKGIVTGSDKNLWFAEPGTHSIGRITTSGTITQYALSSSISPSSIAAGPDGDLWYSTGSNKIAKLPTGPVVEPSKVVAPAPTGVSCSPSLQPGCRALSFKYAFATTAKGENQSEWGEYYGRLAEVLLVAYNTSSKKMQETAVAEYSYDKQGRLRAEWDPRISPALKTSYGYDEEGHVTALTSPGQESWAFTYGMIAGDTGAGRLLKATQAPASAPLWGGEVTKNTESPKVTGSALEGVRLAVSNGAWSGKPTTYGYQWEDCNAYGEACKPIPGATNANYTLRSGDAGDTIVATVEATNGGGSVAMTSSATSVVQAISSANFTEYALPAGSGPVGISSGPDGNVWFANATSKKIGKITSGGTVTEYGAGENKPESITSGPDGNLWFTARSTNKIGKITTSGVITEYTLSGGISPVGITAGPDGNMWFTEYGKIGKITTSGVITEYALPEGGTPAGITTGPDGNLWFTDEVKSKIGKITTSGAITEYALPGGSSPRNITAGPDGNLWYADWNTSKIGKITTSGAITEYALPGRSSPFEITVGHDGNVWFAEWGFEKIGKITTSGAITQYALPERSEPKGIAVGPDGNLWYTDNGTSKIGKIGAAGGAYLAPQPGLTIDYNVPLQGLAAPYQMGVNAATHKPEPEQWGQKDDPVEATAIFSPDEPQSWPATGYKRASVYYLDEQGRQVNVASPSTSSNGSIATTEYNEFNDVVRTLSPGNRQTALEAGSKSVEVSKLLDTQSTYNGEGAKEGEVEEPGSRLIETLGPQHEIKYVAGKEQKESLAREHAKFFYDEGAPGGEKYDLVTKSTTLAQLANEEEVEVRKTTTSYSGQSNLGWKLRTPTSVTADPEGKKITHTTLYNATTAQITETRAPAGSGGGSAHDMRTIYYSAEANTEGFAACGSHPEWAGLVCETLPAKQPEGSGVPKLPVTTVTYNVWDEPLVTTETFGSTVRTKTSTYDEAGRLTSSETTSTADAALPKVTSEYNSATGLLEKQSTTVEGKTKTITSKYNTLGQRTEYVDADGNTAKYKYAGPENDGLLEEMSDGSGAGAGKQTYSYNATTKLMEKLTDSSAGTFTASYDVEGKLTSEVYPNGMCANGAYNSVGEATHVEYIKTTNCSEHEPGVWFSETRNPSVRGETLNRTSTLANESYAYDTVGRLTEAQETPAGEGCHTRVYAYDEESNRTSLTTRAPGGEGKCATEGGTVEKHTYDEANRLTDAGIAYDSFGNVTKLPAADAEGHELTSTFYVDNAVATQSQNGVSSSYYLDPEGRVRETVSGVNTTISHYDSTGEAVAWTSEGVGKSKRNIPGIDGTLAATQTNSETPVMQLHDLQGDVVATIGDKAGETKLLSTYNSTEFGVPNAGKAPPTFAWLGAGDVASALPSGVITYGATSYVPQTGRALQSEQVEPPGLPGGAGAGAAYTMQEEPWNMQGAAREGAEAPGLEAARELTAEEAALSAAIAAAGEGIDPTSWFRKAEAREFGRKYLEIATWAEVINVIGSIPDDLDKAVEGVLADKFSLDFALDWFHKAGQKLTQCGNEGKPWVSCKFKYKNWHLGVDLPLIGEVGVTLVNIFSGPETEKCTALPVVSCSRLNS
jgi:streptogramin lyase